MTERDEGQLPSEHPLWEPSENLPVEIRVDAGKSLHSSDELNKFIDSEPESLFGQVERLAARGYHTMVELSPSPREVRVFAAKSLDLLSTEAEQAAHSAIDTAKSHPKTVKTIGAGILVVGLVGGVLFTHSKKK